MWPTKRWMELGLGNDLARLHGDLGRMFAPPGRGAAAPAEFPLLRVSRGPDSVTLMTELPGVSPENLEVEVLDDTVTLSGTKSPHRVDEEEGDGVRYHRRECGKGEFSRSVRLPYRIDSDTVEASLQHGVLTLVLPKAVEDLARKIVVQAH